MRKPKPPRACLDCPTIVERNRKRCPVCADVERERQVAQWKQENPSKVRAHRKAWRQRNSERMRNERNMWREGNA